MSSVFAWSEHSIFVSEMGEIENQSFQHTTKSVSCGTSTLIRAAKIHENNLPQMFSTLIIKDWFMNSVIDCDGDHIEDDIWTKNSEFTVSNMAYRKLASRFLSRKKGCKTFISFTSFGCIWSVEYFGQHLDRRWKDTESKMIRPSEWRSPLPLYQTNTRKTIEDIFALNQLVKARRHFRRFFGERRKARTITTHFVKQVWESKFWGRKSSHGVPFLMDNIAIHKFYDDL